MEKKVFCYGDSNTYGYDPVTHGRHAKSVRWTGILQQLLGQEYEVVEQGCNSRTTVYPVPGEEWKSGMYGLKVCLATYKPVDIMILMLGTNDLKEQFHASAKEIAENAEKLVITAKEFMFDKVGFAPKMILVSPIEIGEGIENTYFGNEFKADARPRSLEFPRYYREVAERQGCYFLDAAQYGWPSKEDRLHMMPEAHAALARALYEAVMEVEKQEQSACKGKLWSA